MMAGGKGKKMKFMKKRNYDGSLRKVWSDDKEVCFGVVGTVGDLLKEGILEYADYSRLFWASVLAVQLTVIVLPP